MYRVEWVGGGKGQYIDSLCVHALLGNIFHSAINSSNRNVSSPFPIYSLRLDDASTPFSTSTVRFRFPHSIFSSSVPFEVASAMTSSADVVVGTIDAVGGAVNADHKLLNAPLACDKAPPTALLVVLTA